MKKYYLVLQLDSVFKNFIKWFILYHNINRKNTGLKEKLSQYFLLIDDTQYIILI